MIAIGTPSSRPMQPWSYIKSLVGLQVEESWAFYHEPGYGGVADACNRFFAHALEDGASWFCIVAGDAVMHPQTIQRLLDRQAPAIAPLNFTRYAPPFPCVYFEGSKPGHFRAGFDEVNAFLLQHPELLTRRNKAQVLDPVPPGSLWKVEAFGTHVSLFSREVVESVGYPWFEAQDAKGGGEDFDFLAKVRDKGYPLYVDMSVVTGHCWGDWAIGPLDYIIWQQSAHKSLDDSSVLQIRIKGIGHEPKEI